MIEGAQFHQHIFQLLRHCLLQVVLLQALEGHLPGQTYLEFPLFEILSNIFN